MSRKWARSFVLAVTGVVAAALLAGPAPATPASTVQMQPRLDPSFGGDGKVPIPTGAFRLVVQPDGKYLVLAFHRNPDGSADGFELTRVTTSGAVDSSFGRAGTVVTDLAGDFDTPAALTLQRDGRIVVVANRSSRGVGAVAVLRYRADGRPDPTFSHDGKVVTDVPGVDEVALGVRVLPAGRIMVGGATAAPSTGSATSVVLLRYNPGGRRDLTFGGRGWMIRPSPVGSVWSAFVGPRGATFVLGFVTFAGPDGQPATSAVARFRSDGSLDSSYGERGVVRLEHGAASLAAARHGRLLAVGGQTVIVDFDEIVDAAVSRITPDGRLDPTFGTNGKAVISFEDSLFHSDAAAAAAVDTRGRTLVVGDTDARDSVARLRRDGTLDPAFGTSGLFEIPLDNPSGNFSAGAQLIATQRHGRVILAGFDDAGPFLARLIAD